MSRRLPPCLLAAALSLAPAAARAQEPALSDASLDSQVAIPKTSSFSRKAFFGDLEGFEETSHLVPILLPAETRYRVLQNPEEIREALALDPDLARLNELLRGKIIAELSREQAGRELLESLDMKLPPVLFAEDSKLLGSYRPSLDAIAVNWKEVRRVFPEAAKMDCGQLQAFLLQDPARLGRVAREFAPVLLHELVHCRQHRIFGFDPKRVPNSARYLEMEEEAYFDGTRFLVERLQDSTASLTPETPLNRSYASGLLLFVSGLPDYFAAIRHTQSRSGAGAMTIASAIRLQTARISETPEGPERDMARVGLIQLERAKEFYDQVRDEMDQDWPGIAIPAAAALARLHIKRNPELSLSLAVEAASLIKEEGLRPDKTLQPLFERAARDYWARLSHKGGNRGQVRKLRLRYARALLKACEDAGIECGPALADLRLNP